MKLIAADIKGTLEDRGISARQMTAHAIGHAPGEDRMAENAGLPVCGNLRIVEQPRQFDIVLGA